MTVYGRRTPTHSWVAWAAVSALALGSGVAVAVDLGAVPVRTVVPCRLALRNPRPERALFVTGARASCACLKVLSYPAELAAAAEGTVYAALVLPDAGAFRHALHFTIGGPDEVRAGVAVITLELSGVARSDAAAPALPGCWNLPPALLEVRRQERDAAIYVDPTGLPDPSGAAGAPLFVDVRRWRTDCGRLPGAPQVPPFALPTRPLPTTQRVLLVDEGWGDPALEALCRRLRRQAGTDTLIVDGGLARWVAAGRPFVGDARARRGLVRLPPAAYYVLRSLGSWTVLDASARPSPEMDLLFPGHEFVGRDVAVERVKACLVAPAAAGQGARCLIVDETGDDPRLEARLATAAPAGSVLLFLDGGWRGFARYLEQQAAVAKRDTHAADGCNGCPPSAAPARARAAATTATAPP